MSGPDVSTPHASHVSDLWSRVDTAKCPMLILDYDGTLAPFVVDRMKALPLDGVEETLRAIRDRTSTQLAIVTGRPLGEILELLGDLAVPMAGSQGIEFRYPDGRWFTLLPSAAQCARLLRAEQEALQFAPRERVERKPASVALHTRGVPAPLARAGEESVCRLWSLDTNEIGLECRSFLGGVELRPRETTKGSAVRTLITRYPEADTIVYIGDDDTDEDAFRAIKGCGFSIRVGNATTPTSADARLRDVADVRRFLKRWFDVASVCSGEGED